MRHSCHFTVVLPVAHAEFTRSDCSPGSDLKVALLGSAPPLFARPLWLEKLERLARSKAVSPPRLPPQYKMSCSVIRVHWCSFVVSFSLNSLCD